MRSVRWLSTIPLRLRSLFRKKAVETELDEELRFHVEKQTEEYRAKGLTAEDARSAALRAFGGVEQRKEECRDTRRVRIVEETLQDVRYGVRLLRKSPGFAATAILTVALGVGATTAIFSAVYSILLRPLPFPQADRLVTVWGWNSRWDAPYYSSSGPDYLDWRRNSTSFQELAAIGWQRRTLKGAGEPQSIVAYSVTGNFFDVFRTPPVLGRVFTEREVESGAAHPIVIGNTFWRTAYGSDPSVIGRTMILDETAYTVAGVAAPQIEYRQDFPPQVFVPLSFQQDDTTRRSRHWLWVIGRLKPEVTRAQALAQMRSLARQLEREHPDTNSNSSVKIFGLQELLTDNVREPLFLLYAAAALILLLACVNTASLLLVRSTSRQREIAVRCAIGAGRRRLVRQLLTESLIVAFAGGALGSLVAFRGVDGLSAIIGQIAQTGIAGSTEVHVYAPVWAFTLVVTLATGILSSLYPALHVSRASVSVALHSGGRTASAGLAQSRPLHVFTVAQIALAFILLAGAGLLTRSLGRLVKSTPGFNPANLMAVEVNRPDGPGEQPGQRRAEFSRQVIERLGALPGVLHAASVNIHPMGGNQLTQGFGIEGRPAPKDMVLAAELRSVSAGYLQTMGIPLLRGRRVEPSDDGRIPVVVVDEAFARRYFPGEDPVGKRLLLSQRPHEIIGVVGRVKLARLSEREYRPHMYVPLAQYCPANITFVVRVAQDPATLASSIRRAVWDVDPAQPILRIDKMQDLADKSISPQRVLAMLLSTLAALALLLSTLGTYGVMAFYVGERTREMAIRVAFGARPRDVFRAVLRRGAVLAGLGLGIGLAGALALHRLLSTFLFEIKPYDPATYAAAFGLLAMAVLVACGPPARRASRVEPMQALRGE